MAPAFQNANRAAITIQGEPIQLEAPIHRKVAGSVGTGSKSVGTDQPVGNARGSDTGKHPGSPDPSGSNHARNRRIYAHFELQHPGSRLLRLYWRVGLKSARLRVRSDDVFRVANRLTQRDRDILRLLSNHRVFTTEQLTDVYFSNPTTARHRLTELHRLRLVDRFKPRRWLNDSAPYHYVLGEIGAMVVMAERDDSLDKFHWKADRAMAIGSSQRLEHLLALNQFFIELMKEARYRPEANLREWWSERYCATAMAKLVYPDAYGVWEEDGSKVEFMLEYDRGTESLDRLAAKLEGYEDLELATKVRRWVLFSLRTERREAGVRRVLAGSSLPMATAARAAGRPPYEGIWSPTIGSRGVVRLSDLPSHLGITGSPAND